MPLKSHLYLPDYAPLPQAEPPPFDPWRACGRGTFELTLSVSSCPAELLSSILQLTMALVASQAAGLCDDLTEPGS